MVSQLPRAHVQKKVHFSVTYVMADGPESIATPPLNATAPTASQGLDASLRDRFSARNVMMDGRVRIAIPLLGAYVQMAPPQRTAQKLDKSNAQHAMPQGGFWEVYLILA